MAYPFDEGRAFMRSGPKYVHDWFGADTGGRSIPHSGSDASPSKSGDTSVHVRSVYGGTVVETGFDRESGFYVIVAEADGAWWGYGHNSINLVVPNQKVAEGQAIARMGMTGTGAKGVHVHIWRATSLAAARRVVHGYTNLKNGRSTAKWAASMGLTDPMPHIEKSVEDDELKYEDKVWFQSVLNDAEKRIRAEAKEQVAEARAEAAAARVLAQEARDALVKPVGGFRPIDVLVSHAPATLNAVKALAKGQGVVLDPKAVASDLLIGVAESILNRGSKS